jgi:hypothetical protein
MKKLKEGTAEQLRTAMMSSRTREGAEIAQYSLKSSVFEDVAQVIKTMAHVNADQTSVDEAAKYILAIEIALLGTTMTTVFKEGTVAPEFKELFLDDVVNLVRTWMNVPPEDNEDE